MSMRVCATPGCWELCERGAWQGMCPACRRAHDQARGTKTERGYGAKHNRLRKQWAPKVAGGRVSCWRCGERISPLEPWDLGHDDRDRKVWRGPEHVLCNRRTRAH